MDLPKRPRQHSLEDESIIEFKKILPQEWICRNGDKDYGVDLEVEIVRDGCVTGKKFYVQLKATDAIQKSVFCTLNISTLNYYNELKIPTIIVRYLSFKNIFYAKYFNDIDFKSNSLQKTFRINFFPEDIIDFNFFNILEAYINKIDLIKSISFPIPIFFDFDSLDQNQYSSFKFQLMLEEKIGYEFFKFTEKEKGLINFKYCDGSLKLNIPELKGIFIDKLYKPDIESVSKAMFVSIVVLLKNLNKNQMLAKLIFENQLEHLLIDNNIISLCFEALLCSTYIKETNDLFEFILKNNSTDKKFMYLNLEISCLILLRREYFYRLENILENISISSVALYNFGSLIKEKSSKKAIKFYLRALKKDNFYKDKDYFYWELGNLFWRENKFKWAKISLGKALELNQYKDNNYKFLYADSLMFSGNYEEALNILKAIKFEENSLSRREIETSIKITLLSEIIERFNIKSQDRSIIDLKKIDSLFENLDVKTDEEIYEISKVALVNDPLNCLGWVNFAYKSKDLNDKAFAFSFAGILNQFDTESFINSFVTFLYTKKEVEAIFILTFMLKSYGESIIPKILKLFNSLDENQLNNFKFMLSSCLVDIEEKEPIKLRIPNEKGEMINIFDYFKN